MTCVQTPDWTMAQKTGVGLFVGAVFAAAYFIGTGQWLTNDGPYLMAPIALTAAAPVILFLGAYAGSVTVRNFVLAQDLGWLTRMQQWRVVGFAFLPIYALGHLPGLFAWPAGLGDFAVGITAFFVVSRLAEDPDYTSKRGFLLFNFMGLADFAAALVTAGLTSGAYPKLVSHGVTSAAMDVWPLNIFPSFFVPLFMILHLAVLLKLYSLRASRKAGVEQALQAG